MRFIKSILQTTPFEKRRFGDAWKSAAIRMDGNVAADKYPWKYQLRFFISVLLAFWTIPFRLRSAKALTAIYYDNQSSPDSILRRRYFLKKHLLGDVPDASIQPYNGDGGFPPIYFNRLGFRTIWNIHRISWRVVWAAFTGLFSGSRVHWLWKRQLVHYLIQQAIFQHPDKPQVFFFSYEPHTYLSTFVGSHLLRHHPIIISSNSILLRGNRYQYNPLCDFKLCSSVLEEESAHYIAKGWMKFRSVETWGLEEAVVFDQLEKREPRIDVGIYSSGSWARTDDLWRSGDLKAIGSYAYVGNKMYVWFLRILEAVVELRREKGITAKVYFHPFEVGLMQRHGIQPPYMELLEQAGIEWEKEGKSSIENFYEARLGVSISSTILFDRLHYDLASIYFEGADIPFYTIDEAFMGKYRELCFHNMEEMKAMIMKEIGKS